jgi:hypothetical protein
MKKGIGMALVVFGLVLTLLATTMDVKETPDLIRLVSYLVGTYLPGLVCLAIGAALCRDKKPPDHAEAETSVITLQVRRKSDAGMGVVGGIVLTLMGTGLSRQGHELLPFGLAVSLGGWGLMIWGAASYMKWKGYSGWFGLFGLLLLPGLIIVACLPNKMKGTGDPSADDTKNTRPVVVVAVVAFVLLMVLPMAAFLAVPILFPHTQRNDHWTTVSTNPPKFVVEMPGAPKRQVVSRQDPDSGVTVTAYSYESYDGIAAYSATFRPLPPDASISLDETAVVKTLDAILDEFISRVNGQLLYRKTISLGKDVGREQAVEYNPHATNRAGEPITAKVVARVYLVRDSVLLLTFILDKNDKDPSETDSRMTRFFDSLELE